MNMDHHGRAPYGTLWTDLDLGPGHRAPSTTAAPATACPPTGAYTTVVEPPRPPAPSSCRPSSYGPT